MARLSGTEGYAQEAPVLLERYESVTTAEALRAVIHLIPEHPCDLLDIGAGTGRDAASFALAGHRVVAVEPTDEMRLAAQKLHPAPNIDWVADGLPDLAVVRARGQMFDVVTMTAVWMHLDPDQRARAMPVVCSVLRSGGVMTLSLRHGPIPPGRRMFDVSGEETIALAAKEGLACIVHVDQPATVASTSGVVWTWLGFRK